LQLKYFREGAMQRIKNAVYSIKDYYIKDEVWIDKYFDNEEWKVTSKINVDSFSLLIPVDDNNYDINNIKIIYDAMKNLKPYQANEERLWSYLTHVYCWDYMRRRWPVENYLDNNKSNFINTLHERYFFKSKTKRSLIRNGLSRLWWFGYITYDENKTNPFSLTEIMLSRQDIAESVMGRSFSNNPKIVKALLSVLEDRIDQGFDLPKREVIRDLCKYLSHRGGSSLIDAFDRDEIEIELTKRLEKLL